MPGRLERDWVLWVELWLRAAREPELRPLAAELYQRYREWLVGRDRGRGEERRVRGAGGPRPTSPTGRWRCSTGPACGRCCATRRWTSSGRGASPPSCSAAELGVDPEELIAPRGALTANLNQGSGNDRGKGGKHEPSATDRSHSASADPCGRRRGDRRARRRRDQDRRRRRADRGQPARGPLLVRLQRAAAGRGAGRRRGALLQRARRPPRRARRPRRPPLAADRLGRRGRRRIRPLARALGLVAARRRPAARPASGFDHRWRGEIEKIVRDGQVAGAFGGRRPSRAALAIASLLDGLTVQVATRRQPDVSAADGRGRGRWSPSGCSSASYRGRRC